MMRCARSVGVLSVCAGLAAATFIATPAVAEGSPPPLPSSGCESDLPPTPSPFDPRDLIPDRIGIPLPSPRIVPVPEPESADEPPVRIPSQPPPKDPCTDPCPDITDPPTPIDLVSTLTGRGSTSRTDKRWQVNGTDLGIMWESTPQIGPPSR